MVLRSNRDPSVPSRLRCTQLPALTPALVFLISSNWPWSTLSQWRTTAAPVKRKKVSQVDLCAVGGGGGRGTAVFVGVDKCTEWHRLCTTPIRGTGLVTSASSTQWMGGQSHPLCLSQSSLLCTGTGEENTAPDPEASPPAIISIRLPLMSSHPSAQPLTRPPARP